jgi:hypothetical protein
MAPDLADKEDGAPQGAEARQRPNGGMMKHATSMVLHAYWHSCHDRAGVSAGGIRATELAPILPCLFLIDLTPRTGARFRYCGAAMALRYGRDLTDESFLGLWNFTDRETLQRDLTAMATKGTGLVAGVMGETTAGGFSAFEMLILPLSGGGCIAGAIGTMARIGGHEEANRIRARLVSQYLRSVRFLAEFDRPNSPPDCEAQNRADPVSDVRRRYHHLSVVNGGRMEATTRPLTDP